MFVRKKVNKSGRISVQVIDKSSGRYHVVRTIGCSDQEALINQYVRQGQQWIKNKSGAVELDFKNYNSVIEGLLDGIISHKLVGVELTLGKVFDQIGFNQIEDDLFRHLVLYRLVYPRSKLKTTEYLYRYEQMTYSEDAIYRYMDKLHKVQIELVQQISYKHTIQVMPQGIGVVFYDVTTIYFEIDRGDDLRKTGFSKEGKHQNPQIVLGLLVSKGGYPLAYQIFEGNKFEGHTMLPVVDCFKEKFNIDKLVIVADSGLMSKNNIHHMLKRGDEFILGARIKNEPEIIRKQILELNLENGQSAQIEKGDLRLIINYSTQRAKKDQYNRDKGLKRLKKLIATGKLSKSQLNKRGYNKFLQMDGQIDISIDQDKVDADKKWDGLKGYITNSSLSTEELLVNYNHLWQIEKAFRIAKTELKIRPIYHYKQKRIETHICLNFAAYKVYKELERILQDNNSVLSAQKVIEIAQSIYQIQFQLPNNNSIYSKNILLLDEQKQVAKLFDFD